MDSTKTKKREIAHPVDEGWAWMVFIGMLIFFSLFNFLNYFVWLRITDEGPVPEMRIWSILYIESDLK